MSAEVGFIVSAVIAVVVWLFSLHRRCTFTPHDWIPLQWSMWQCQRCKTVSLGRSVASWHKQHGTRERIDPGVDRTPIL